MPALQAFASGLVCITLAVAQPAPAPQAAPPASAEPVPVAPVVEAPAETGPPPNAIDESTPSSAPGGAATEAPPSSTTAPQASPATTPAEAAPPPPAAAAAIPPPEVPLQRIDAEAAERMRRGQRIMNISGIVMASGGMLLLVGVIAGVAAGRAPNADNYDDIDAYRADTRDYQRKAIAGSIISLVGGFNAIGGAIAFIVGGAKYLRGKRAGRKVALGPTGALRF